MRLFSVPGSPLRDKRAWLLTCPFNLQYETPEEEVIVCRRRFPKTVVYQNFPVRMIDAPERESYE